MDFDKICTMFTMQEPFYGILLSSVERVPVSGRICPTLGVTRNGNVFRLIYNNDFVKNLDVSTTLELLKHEMCHLAFNHFSIWETEPKTQNEQKVRNIAADLEVNSYLNKANIHNIDMMYANKFGWEEQAGTKEYFKRLVELAEQMKKQKQQATQQVQKPCNGGKSNEEQDKDTQNNNQSEANEPEKDSGTNANDDGQNQEPDNNDGVGAPRTQSNSDELNDVSSEEDDKENISGEDEQDEDEDNMDQEFIDDLVEFDDHSQWPDDEESKDVCSQMVEDMVIAAAEECEKSCGSVPAEMKGRVDEIVNKRKPKPVADWKRYVRRYLGHEFSEFLKKSKKRESKRFPDAAGTRKRRKSNILVGIDTSGSVSMPEYIEFFGQIRTLTSTATFDVVECDAEIQNKYTFRNKPNLEIHGGGGTSFIPVIDYFIENRKKYDALIYFTDGECSVPDNTPKETLWVISSRGDKKNRKSFQKNGASVVYIPKKD